MKDNLSALGCLMGPPYRGPAFEAYFVIKLFGGLHSIPRHNTGRKVSWSVPGNVLYSLIPSIPRFILISVSCVILTFCEFLY